MFSSLFPEHCSFSIVSDAEWPDRQVLFSALQPEERKILSRFGSTDRQRDFALGRIAARRALQSAGDMGTAPLLPAASGEALWPAGYCGSLAHSGGWAAAVVAKTEVVRTIGIDLQDLLRHPDPKILPRIATANEQNAISAHGDPALQTLTLFAAKEAIYKALFPVCRKFIAFKEVECSWTDRQTITATLQKGLRADLPSGFHFPVRYEMNSAFVLCGTWL